MSRTRRGLMIAALTVTVAALLGSVGVAAGSVVQHATGTRAAAVPPMMGAARADRTGVGMMGSSGMMGSGPAGMRQAMGHFALAGDGRPVTSLDGARQRAQALADRLDGGLRVGEVMQFSNGYYAEVLSADGQGATEVLINPSTGAVSVELGPAMMWNTRYGMHARGTQADGLTQDQAVAAARTWLDRNRPGLTTDDVTAFPGYFTLETRKDGRIVGMMSVDASSGAVWYHTWHGTFVAVQAD